MNTFDPIQGRTSGAWPIQYEALGNPAHPAIVLIMGLGLQLVAWPDSFCQALVAGGYRVVRFDNRDCGLSPALLPPLAQAVLTHCNALSATSLYIH